MNKALRVPDYLGHILMALERIDRYTDSINEATFLSNEMVQDAVIRNMEIVGEAANNIQRVNPAFAEAHKAVPWQIMYAMRNRLAHGYEQVDFEIVWKTIRHDFPDLYLLIKSVANSNTDR
jgi:uncharacterized protein with HEPN domain